MNIYIRIVFGLLGLYFLGNAVYNLTMVGQKNVYITNGVQGGLGLIMVLMAWLLADAPPPLATMMGGVRRLFRK